MSTYISLLRGINVGGGKTIRMDALRNLFEDLGFTNIRTYVQSGNVIFAAPSQELPGMVKRIETRIHQVYGYHVPVFIRQPDEIQQLLSNNPFLNDRNLDPAKLHVTFIYGTPSDDSWRNLPPPGQIEDEFALAERAIYLFCPNGYGKTKLSNSFFERRLATPTTTRNWNTVNALFRISKQ
jgi:uncharacterized protein (DUF1697 family)